MDVDKLKDFCVTAQESSIRKAAEKRGEKYTTFRKRLLTLESDLNIPLFCHVGGKIRLTMQGQAFLQHAKNIVSYAENQMDLFSQKEENMEGHIKIATSTAMPSLWIVDAIKEFMTAFPKMRVSILGSDREANLFLREADVLLRPLSIANEDYVELPLTNYNMNLYASEEYINKLGLPKDFEDLKQHHIISFGENRSYPYAEMNWHLMLLPNNFQPQLNINSVAAILTAIQNGIGIGSLSQKESANSKTKLIRILENKLTGPTFHLNFCFHKSTKIPKSIQVLYAYLRNYFGEGEQIQEKRSFG